MKYLKLFLLLLISLTYYSLSTSTNKPNHLHTISNKPEKIMEGQRFISSSRKVESELDNLLLEIYSYKVGSSLFNQHLDKIGSYSFNFQNGDNVISKTLDKIKSFEYDPKEGKWSVVISNDEKIEAAFLATNNSFYTIAFKLTYLKILTQWWIYKLKQKEHKRILTFEQSFSFKEYQLYDENFKHLKGIGAFTGNDLLESLELLKILNLINIQTLEKEDIIESMKIVNGRIEEFKIINTIFGSDYATNYKNHIALKHIVKENKSFIISFFVSETFENIKEILKCWSNPEADQKNIYFLLRDKEKSAIQNIFKLFDIDKLIKDNKKSSLFLSYMLTTQDDYFSNMFEQLEKKPSLQKNFFAIINTLHNKNIVVNFPESILRVENYSKGSAVSKVQEFIDLFKFEADDLKYVCEAIKKIIQNEKIIDELFYLGIYLENFTPTLENLFELLQAIDSLTQYFVAPLMVKKD
jgi:hypothetical protein